MNGQIIGSILLVEDDPDIRKTLTLLLSEDGYAVRSVHTARNAIAALEATSPDAILLDLQLPDGSGTPLVSGIRAHTDSPIIVISGRVSLSDKVAALEAGADDYICKPLQIREMCARLRAQIRRYRSGISRVTTLPEQRPCAEPRIVRFRNLILDRAQMQVFDAQNNSLGLTTREFQLLEVLVMTPRQVHTREALLEQVRRDNLDVTDRAIDVQLLRIRRKLGDAIGPDQMIRAVRGVGYILDCATCAA